VKHFLYEQFRDLMMSIDPTDEDDSGDEQRSAGAATPGRKSPAADTADGGDAENAVIVDGAENTMDGLVRIHFIVDLSH
jgi:hypothetical protein